MDQLAIDILKTALYHRPPASGKVTKETIRQLNNHAILALTADAISKYEIESGVQEKVEQVLALQMTQFSAYMNEQSRITAALIKEGCTPAILKGSSAAMYYPDPGLRRMGDIDILPFPRDEDSFKKAKTVFKEIDYKEGAECNRHLAFYKGRREIELHHYFSVRRNDEELRLDAFIDKSTVVEKRIDSFGIYRFYTFPDEVNGLVFLHHISSHLYSGLGFRQIIDWLMYVNAVVTDEFWQQRLQPIAASTGVEILAKAVTRMGELFLGAPEHSWCADADEKVCKQLFDLICEAGNFGRNRVRKDNLTTSVLNDGITFKKLQQRGLSHWSAAQKHKILRPFAWIYQICRYIRKGLKRDKNSAGVVANYKEHRKQKQLFEKLGIPHEEEDTAANK